MRLRPMELLAFKDECITSEGRHVTITETLRRHVRTMYELYMELFHDRGWTSISSKRVGLGEDELDYAVRLAIAFHDSGKVFYQDRIARGKGAPLHEAYSLLLFQDYADSVIRRNIDGNVVTAIMWSILTHHLSMRSPQDMLLVLHGAPRMVGVPREAELGRETAKMLVDAIRDTIGPVTLSPRKYMLGSVGRVIVELLGNLHQYYRLSIRISRVLIVTDNMAAYLNRVRHCMNSRKRVRVFISDIPGPEYDHVKGELISWLDLFS